MPRISLAFFGAAVLFALTGMAMGIWMGTTEDFTYAPVHAHINLLGWVTLALMGTFYALAGDAAPRLLAWVNFWVSVAGNLLTLPMLVMFLGGNRSVIPPMAAGEVAIVVGMLVFGFSVLTVARRPAAA
ncbi:MAG: hypothetical protein ACHP84_21070 [Caulobacterales bacterium]